MGALRRYDAWLTGQHGSTQVGVSSLHIVPGVRVLVEEAKLEVNDAVALHEVLARLAAPPPVSDRAAGSAIPPFC